MTKKTKLRPIDKPLYRYWQTVYLSFFSPSAYEDVYRRWKGLGIFYLLMVIAIFCIPLSIKSIVYMNDYINKQLIQPLEKMPPIYVQNGKASLDKPMPYSIKNDKNEIVAIIDTTGQVKEISSKYPQLSVLVTKDSIYFRQPEPSQFLGLDMADHSAQIIRQKFGHTDTQVVEMKKLIDQSSVSTVTLAVQTMIYPLVTLTFFSIYIVFLLTFALLGQLIAQVFFSVKLKYKQASRLLAVAMTPQILFYMLLLTFQLNFYGAGIASSIIVFGYFCFAVVYIKGGQKKLVHG